MPSIFPTVSDASYNSMKRATFRPARADDLAAIVDLLADDPLGADREGAEGNLAAYERAFAEIAADENNTVLVGEIEGSVVATLQLTFIANLTFEGSRRALIEAVRVAAGHRGKGLGRALMNHAVDMARDRGCGIVQLTSNKQRSDAIAFYESIGFESTHVGLKLYL